jgi:hypothetical protein
MSAATPASALQVVSKTHRVAVEEAAFQAHRY